jgi:hypothetical protein
VANFPTLSTGAVAQYPSDRTLQFSTQAFRFLDGSEQRFQGYGSALRQWSIRLDLLDETELINLQSFLASEEGRSGSFSFTDPFDGTVYSNCSFGKDTLALQFAGPQKGVTQVTVRQNR